MTIRLVAIVTLVVTGRDSWNTYALEVSVVVVCDWIVDCGMFSCLAAAPSVHDGDGKLAMLSLTVCIRLCNLDIVLGEREGVINCSLVTGGAVAATSDFSISSDGL